MERLLKVWRPIDELFVRFHRENLIPRGDADGGGAMPISQSAIKRRRYNLRAIKASVAELKPQAGRKGRLGLTTRTGRLTLPNMQAFGKADLQQECFSPFQRPLFERQLFAILDHRPLRVGWVCYGEDDTFIYV